ncbi:MAG: polysaccharide deacetylase family protein [Candidatus Methylacidiphilales bacterium]|nr:polysaccharide deacetylase family protein [Candidatus Methylacidiphilales bacterium]
MRAIALTYDDSATADYRLVEILNKHGIIGTFHINSGGFGMEGRVKTEDIRGLYDGHEISVHGVHHMHQDYLPPEQLAYEIMEDRRRLEEVCGYAVVGMAHPYGSYSEEVVQMLVSLGFKYARPVVYTQNYNLPADWMRWSPTCHHNEALKHLEAFMKLNVWDKPRLLYVFGHSFEFERQNNWAVIEDFAREAGNLPGVWYATSIQIADYMASFRNVRVTADRSRIHNMNATSVWITANRQPLEIPGGATVVLPPVAAGQG